MVGKGVIADLRYAALEGQFAHAVLRGAQQQFRAVFGIENIILRFEVRIVFAHRDRLQGGKFRKRRRIQIFQPAADRNGRQFRAVRERLGADRFHAVGNNEARDLRIIHEHAAFDCFRSLSNDHFGRDPHIDHKFVAAVNEVAVRTEHGIFLGDRERLNFRTEQDPRADLPHGGRQMQTRYRRRTVKRALADIFKSFVERERGHRFLILEGIRQHDLHAIGQSQFGLHACGRNGIEHCAVRIFLTANRLAVEHALDCAVEGIAFRNRDLFEIVALIERKLRVVERNAVGKIGIDAEHLYPAAERDFFQCVAMLEYIAVNRFHAVGQDDFFDRVAIRKSAFADRNKPFAERDIAQSGTAREGAFAHFGHVAERNALERFDIIETVFRNGHDPFGNDDRSQVAFLKAPVAQLGEVRTVR